MQGAGWDFNGEPGNQLILFTPEFFFLTIFGTASLFLGGGNRLRAHIFSAHSDLAEIGPSEVCVLPVLES
jgi:hypothetical protein